MSEVETIEDKTNALLKRREVVCVFRDKAGRLAKGDAVKMVAEKLKVDKFIVPVTLHCETGKTDVRGVFYVYDNEDLAKKHLHKYMFLRTLPKEERKKAIEEAKKSKKQAKEAAKEGAAAKKPAKKEAKAEPEKEAPAAKKEPAKKEAAKKAESKEEAK